MFFKHMPLRLSKSSTGIALFYLLGAALWIYGSDQLVSLLARRGFDASLLQTLKGWLFVTGTAALLLLLLRRREAVISHSQAKMRAEKQRHEALIAASPVPIIALDREGQVTTWSPAAEKVLGWSKGEVMGAHPPHVPAARQHEFQTLLKRVLEGGAVHAVETHCRRKNGSPIDVSLSAAPIRTSRAEDRAEDCPKGVEAVLVDITDRKRYEQGLIEAREEAERARDRAEEMSRLKSSFLANMSHEIRTPLTAIMGFADMLRSEQDGQVAEDAQIIYRSSERLMDTLTSVLDLAQFESEAISLHPTRSDLRETIRETIRPFQAQAREQELQFRCELPEEPLRVDHDPEAIQRVLYHLVSNAVKFTREGGVSVSARREGDEVTIQVADTGVGIGEAFLPKAFEAFQQESAGLSREFEGNGLGLTIAEQLSRAMGGRIDIESQKGQGSIFEVRLPARATPEAKDTSRADAASEATAVDATSTAESAVGGAVESFWAPYRQKTSDSREASA